jgi:hypothetical protein
MTAQLIDAILKSLGAAPLAGDATSPTRRNALSGSVLISDSPGRTTGGKLRHRIALALVLALGFEGGKTLAGDIVPMGSYDFFIQGGNKFVQTATQIKITAKAKDGTTFEQTFDFGVGTDPDAARDFVKKALDKAGWNVDNLGAKGISILGTKKGSPITEVDGGGKPANPNVVGLFVSNDSTEGVKKGEAVVGEGYKFTFLPLNPNSKSLDQNGTLTALLNGTSYSTPVKAGETASQLEQDLYSTLTKALVPASLANGQVAVAFDANGTRVTDTQLVLDASGLETEIIIPRLSAVPEPASLVMAASVTLLGLSYWWIRRRRLSADDTGR